MSTNRIYEPALEHDKAARWTWDPMIEATLGVMPQGRQEAASELLGDDWLSPECMTEQGLLPTWTRKAGLLRTPDPNASDRWAAEHRWLADRILEANAGVLEDDIKDALEEKYGPSWRSLFMAVTVGLLPTRTRLERWIGAAYITEAEREACLREFHEARAAGTLPEEMTIWAGLNLPAQEHRLP